MFDFNTLAEFSRTNCVSICAFLVPANLVATSLTMILTALRRPQVQVWQAGGIASIFALVMILHVFTWFMIGVVMAPTYILLWLGSSCLFTNFAAIFLSFALQHKNCTESNYTKKTLLLWANAGVPVMITALIIPPIITVLTALWRSFIV